MLNITELLRYLNNHVFLERENFFLEKRKSLKTCIITETKKKENTLKEKTLYIYKKRKIKPVQ